MARLTLENKVLPDQIKETQKSIDKLDNKNQQLSERLLNSKDLDDKLMIWFSEQVTQLEKDKKFKSSELAALTAHRAELLDESGLNDIQRQAKKALNGFDSLTRFQQKALLQKIISKIIIRSDNQLEIFFINEGEVTIPGRTPELESYLNGGLNETRTNRFLAITSKNLSH